MDKLEEIIEQIHRSFEIRTRARDQALKQARQTEKSPLARDALDRLIKNADIALRENLPLCQDCGTAIVFLEIGQDVHITGGSINAAATEGVRQGYDKGYLRKSIVKQPFSERVNTGDNTPPVLFEAIEQRPIQIKQHSFHSWQSPPPVLRHAVTLS